MLDENDKGEDEVARSLPIKGRAVATTVYLLPEDHKRMRIACAEMEISFQTMFMDAMDKALMERHMPPLERWPARRRR